MSYGNPCLVRPAISGEARDVTQLPASTFGSVSLQVQADPTVPFCSVEYYAVPDGDGPQVDCRLLPNHLKMAKRIRIYLKWIHVRGHSYEFTKNFVSQLAGGSEGFRLGTQVGSLLYDGKGHWNGSIKHPAVAGKVHLSVMARNCQTTSFVGKYGPTADNLSLRIVDCPSPLHVDGVTNPSLMQLGDTWFDPDDWCGGSTADDCPFHFAPSYYFGLPTRYAMSGGDWSETIDSGPFAYADFDPPFYVYDSGFFNGRAIVRWLNQVEPNPCSRSLRPQVWQWTPSQPDPARTLNAGDKGWVRLNADQLNTAVIDIGWGLQDGAYAYPIMQGLFNQGGTRRYHPLSNDLGGGVDWFDATVLTRVPSILINAQANNGNPPDDQLTPWLGLAPPTLTMTPV